MRNYDVIAVGSGSAMYVVAPFLERNPEARAAVIDKDEPGGICLTRGCIPSKLLIYPATLRRLAERGPGLGVDIRVAGVDFGRVMDRMRASIGADIEAIRKHLSAAPNIDYFHGTAEFVAPRTLQVGSEQLSSERILLCTGSRPTIPPIPGLSEAGYLTSDTVLQLTELPEKIAIVGGGFIAAEYGHFFSAMGSLVTVIGRNARFLPAEEPEVSQLVETSVRRYLTLHTSCEVTRVQALPDGRCRLTTSDRTTGLVTHVDVDRILVAVGRESNNDLLRLDRAGIATDPHGWIRVDEFLQTNQPGVWALGDATGHFLFKHKANQDAFVLEENLVKGHRRRTDYHAVPHAVFTEPEVAAVGLGEREALEQLGADRLLVGRYPFDKTAKGRAMGIREGFVKVLVEKGTYRIVGAHIVGPEAAILLQEIVDLMYTPEQSSLPIREGMHIHPALSEVVERAFEVLRPVGPFPHPAVEVSGTGRRGGASTLSSDATQ
ncbi:MAG: dihydrolipoyl dehydrogenase [Thermoplasmatales archaeon]|nr:dihydrolipoyl dehydrogenase [Thermoplasmatales archaeon]